MHKKKHSRGRKPLSLRTLIIATVGLTVAISLIISSVVIAINTANNERTRTNENIRNLANVVRTSPVVIKHLQAHTPPKRQDNQIQTYTHRLQKAMHVDAVVVMNQDLIRYSHPVKSQIGKSFLLRKDAAKSLHGRAHYSQKLGVLGPEYRYFAPIYDHSKQIGIICITVTVKTVNAEIRAAILPIIGAGVIGLIIGIIAAVLISVYLRRRLLGMEPDEIAAQVTELTALKDSMSDGLIAVDPTHVLIQLNAVSSRLFPSLQVGTNLPEDLYQALFGQGDHLNNRTVAVRSRELVVSTAPLMAGKDSLGEIALLRDRSDYEQLVAQLAGTKQYIEALRAQQHEFMNKLQVISGLVELNQYDKLQAFIQDVHHNYQEEFGNLNTRIKLPAVTGFLLAKNNEAHEQGKLFTVTPDSALPAVVGTAPKIESELIKILGNLIDNAFDAVPVKTGHVELALNYDAESKTIILSVTDNGTGIEPALQAKILQKHFSTKGTDRGYGLAFVNDIVNAHHGYLDFAQNEPQGTIIHIELPIQPQSTSVGTEESK